MWSAVIFIYFLTFEICHSEQPSVLENVQNGDISNSVRKNSIDDVYLRFYNGKFFEDHAIIPIPRASELIKMPNFSFEKPTVFYIHGFMEYPDDVHIRIVIGAYQTRGDHNIVLVDWSNMAGRSYIKNAVPNTKKVGDAMGIVIDDLIKSGMNKSLIHVVGHSLGGQIAGFTGKATQKRGIKLPRITVLDAAFPMFYPGLLFGHVSPDDADFVDAIHTDSGLYGTPFNTGTVDFWPNGGVSIQPGCPERSYVPLTTNDLCSHTRSWTFWAETLINEHAMEAIKCSSYLQFRMNLCPQSSEKEYMGFAAKPGMTGNYFLLTNSQKPFGRRENGISGKSSPNSLEY